MNRPKKPNGSGSRYKPNRHARNKQPKGYYEQEQQLEHIHPEFNRMKTFVARRRRSFEAGIGNP